MKGKAAIILIAGLIVGLSLGFIILLSGSGQTAAGVRRLPPTVGSPVQDFELAQPGGETVRLGDLRSKPAVINFWATWCPPCKEEMPLLERFAEKYVGQAIFLGINYAETEDVVTAFAAQEKITFPLLLDRSGIVADLYYVRNYPTTFFIDSEGILRAQHTGLLSEELMTKYLKLIGIE